MHVAEGRGGFEARFIEKCKVSYFVVIYRAF